MDEGMDTGAMLLQERVVIRPDDTAGTLAPRLAEVGGRLLVDTLRQLKAGTLRPSTAGPFAGDHGAVAQERRWPDRLDLAGPGYCESRAWAISLAWSLYLCER